MRYRRALFVLALWSAWLLPPGSALAQAGPSAPPTPDCSTGAQGRPSPLGVSGGNLYSVAKGTCCSGTLGALVEDRRGDEFVLSNNHVIARTSSTARSAVPGEPVVQPGLIDTGCFTDAGDAVGALSRWVPLSFGRKTSNTVDAAIAKIKPGAMDPTGSILNIGGISATPFPFSQLQVGMLVQKQGRSTCLTTGQVDALDATGLVSYDKGCRASVSGAARFVHQILIFSSTGSFAQAGDSGAMVLTQESCPRAIGLLFAGTSNNLAIVSPIHQVLSSFKVSLVGACVNTGGQEGQRLDSSALFDGPSAAFASSMVRAQRVKDLNEDNLFAIHGVAAVGIGSSNHPDEAGLRVYVRQLTAELRAKIPTEIEGVPVTILESGDFQAL